MMYRLSWKGPREGGKSTNRVEERGLNNIPRIGGVGWLSPNLAGNGGGKKEREEAAREKNIKKKNENLFQVAGDKGIAYVLIYGGG